jgi:large subunit ribosomal protein L6
MPVPIPGGVQCALKDSTLEVKGPKGVLTQSFSPRMTINVGESEIVIVRPTEEKQDRATHGLTRALISNMVEGVSKGYERTLQIEGVGYRASLQGSNLNLSLGYSHPVTMEPPAGITFVVEGTQTIKVSGIDRQLVGQVSANIRKVRPPEPYKGKGVRYAGEQVRRKVGKAGTK